MALLGTIRKKMSWLLIIMIGGAMVAFILGDLTGGGQRTGGGETDIAEINGRSVSYQEFRTRLDNEMALRFSERTANESEREQVRNELWNMILEENLLFDDYEDLGVVVLQDELFEQFRNDPPNPTVVQFFTDPQTGRLYDEFINPQTGSLNPDAVIQYFKQLIEANEGPGKAQLIILERALKRQRLQSKYNALIKAGIYATSLEAQHDYTSTNRKAKFRYIMQPYTSIDDSSVVYTDDELEAYYDENKHKAEYQQKENSRSLEYVTYEVTPSESDIEEVRNGITSIIENFKNTDDDSLFVRTENYEAGNFITYYSAGFFPPEVDSLIFKGDTGEVFGPYEEASYYKLAKILDMQSRPDSVKARHILLQVPAGDTLALATAETLADSLKAVIQKQDNFEAMATEFSDDPGSADVGGDLGWFTEGTMVPPFNDSCFEGKVGGMPIVVSQFGVHLIEIMEQTEGKKKLLIAIVQHKIEPASETYERVYNEASTFSINNDTPEKYKQAGNELGIQEALSVKEADRYLNELPNPREIIRWAFQAETGNVSEPFDLGDRFVVVHLTGIKDKGTLPLDDEQIQQVVKTGVITEKKGELLAAKMTGSSIEEIAKKLDIPVESVDELGFGEYSIPAVGSEHRVIGSVFTLQAGQMSVPIKGVQGVFMVHVDQFSDPVPLEDLAPVKERLRQSQAGRVDYQVSSAIQEAAEIEDKRYLFF